MIGPVPATGTPADAAGDVVAAGGFRAWQGPWIRNSTAASQTDLLMPLGAGGNNTTTFHPTRAGSVVGLSLSGNINVAGSALTVRIFKNGVALTPALSMAVGVKLAVATYAKDLYAFAAGDVLTVRYTTDGSYTSTTLELCATMELES